MKTIIDSLPKHLRKYVVDQNYEKYSPEDQAVWRYIMHQLRDYLSKHAHSCYLEGLEKTGITTNKIPHIEEMSEKLKEFGWGAIPVSGFIPPAAFMEFQSLGILPIASDMRSIDHILYTPAPDIVHEAAGHAPILINSEFADYLKRYAEIARKAILSKEDLNQYEAIRILSDIKENPESTPEEIKNAEKHLEKVSAAITKISEAGWLSRMNWWTAEYGLIGDLRQPKIFGAGLLSSVGEARKCLGSSVKKIPLTVDCVETGYDITEPQPQLFVTPDFETLHKVLEDLADKMAFRLGGEVGLSRALEAQTINTVQLDSGLQVSGELEAFKLDDQKQPCFIKFKGPSQISYNYRQIEGQGPDYHNHGYSTPLGSFNGWNPNDGPLSLEKLKTLGIQMSQLTELKYDSGITVTGVVNQVHNIDGEPKLIQFTNCRVEWNHDTLFQPEWGPFDLTLGTSVTSVFAGPADRNFLNDSTDFVAARVPIRKYSQEEQKTHALFQQLRQLRDSQSASADQLQMIIEDWSKTESKNWLVGLEILELLNNLQDSDSLKDSVKKTILLTNNQESQSYFMDGYRLIKY